MQKGIPVYNVSKGPYAVTTQFFEYELVCHSSFIQMTRSDMSCLWVEVMVKMISDRKIA